MHPISALQTEYSLWTRDPEKEVLPAYRELRITFVPYNPLGRGFLTGRFQKPEDLDQSDWRRQNPRFQEENFRKNMAIADAVKQLAKEKSCTPAQLALAWLLAQGDEVVPIPSTKCVKYLEENAAAVNLKLDPQDLARIDQAIPAGAAAGLRYPEAGMKRVNA